MMASWRQLLNHVAATSDAFIARLHSLHVQRVVTDEADEPHRVTPNCLNEKKHDSGRTAKTIRKWP